MSEFIAANQILENGQLPSPVNSEQGTRNLEVEALFVTPLKHRESLSAFPQISMIPRIPLQLSCGEPIFPDVPFRAKQVTNLSQAEQDINTKRNPTRWNSQEDDLLRELVKHHGSRKWKEIAREFSRQSHSARTDIQCLHRYNKCLRPGLLKGPWSPEEDAIILEQVSKHAKSRIKWTQIANKLSGRLGKQVRERWINHLDPSLKHSPWTVEEDAKLFLMQRGSGNKWKKIAQELPGRSENAVKNRFHSLASLYHLPRQEEFLNSDLVSKPEWLEERRIKKTRKYKQRKPRSTRKVTDYSCTSKSIKRTKLGSLQDTLERHINMFEGESYPPLDFTEETSKLPFLEPNIGFKRDKGQQSWANSIPLRIPPKSDKTIPGLVTFTNMPSPFANTGIGSNTRKASNAEIFIFKSNQDTLEEAYQKEFGNQMTNNRYNHNMKVNNLGGNYQQVSYPSISNPIGLGSCFQLNSQNICDGTGSGNIS